MIEITCGACGVKSDAGLWIQTLSGLKLPDGYFQCPECKTAIRVVCDPGEVVDVEGKYLYIPGAKTIESVETVY